MTRVPQESFVLVLSDWPVAFYILWLKNTIHVGDIKGKIWINEGISTTEMFPGDKEPFEELKHLAYTQLGRGLQG